MYGAGNPQMAALGALGALGGSLRDMVMAPVRNWSQATLSHKIIAAGTGAGLAYYLHSKGMADVAVAAVGIGGAYATSMLMHYRQTMGAQANGSILPNGQSSAALPPSQVQNMAAQADAVMSTNGMNTNSTGNSRWSELGPSADTAAVPQPPGPQSVDPVPADSTAGMGGSEWAALG